MDEYQDQEDEISRLSAIISNLKVDYESTISILKQDLAKATILNKNLIKERSESNLVQKPVLVPLEDEFTSELEVYRRS